MAAPPSEGARLPETLLPRSPISPSRARRPAVSAKSQGMRLFPKLALAPRSASEKDGFPAVRFVDSEIQAGVSRLSFALVVKFSGGMPNPEEARRFLASSWALEGLLSAGRWDPRHLLLILQSGDDVARALASQVRRVGSFPFRLFRWAPDFSTKREPPVIASWVQLPGLPLGFFDEGFIGVILSSIGLLVAVDDATMGFKRPSAARACLEIDARASQPTKVWVGQGSSGGFWQKIVYEARLSFCSFCKTHGHEHLDCRKKCGRSSFKDSQPGAHEVLEVSIPAPRTNPPSKVLPFEPAGDLLDSQPSAVLPSSQRIPAKVKRKGAKNKAFSGAVQVPQVSAPRQRTFLEVCIAKSDREGPRMLNAGAVAFFPDRSSSLVLRQLPAAAVEESGAEPGEVSVPPLSSKVRVSPPAVCALVQPTVVKQRGRFEGCKTFKRRKPCSPFPAAVFGSMPADKGALSSAEDGRPVTRMEPLCAAGLLSPVRPSSSSPAAASSRALGERHDTPSCKFSAASVPAGGVATSGPCREARMSEPGFETISHIVIRRAQVVKPARSSQDIALFKAERKAELALRKAERKRRKSFYFED